MIRFFYPDGFNMDTFKESCGMADLIATCKGGWSSKVSIEFAKRFLEKSETTMEALEKEILENGKKLQFRETARQTYDLFKVKKMFHK